MQFIQILGGYPDSRSLTDPLKKQDRIRLLDKNQQMRIAVETDNRDGVNASKYSSQPTCLVLRLAGGVAAIDQTRPLDGASVWGGANRERTRIDLTGFRCRSLQSPQSDGSSLSPKSSQTFMSEAPGSQQASMVDSTCTWSSSPTQSTCPLTDRTARGAKRAIVSQATVLYVSFDLIDSHTIFMAPTLVNPYLFEI